MDYILLFAGGQNNQGGGLMAYLPFILILAIMYFLMIRPQAKRQKEKQKMLSELKKGDRIVTIGGIHGTISGFKGKEKKMLTIKLDKNTTITINRSAISGLLNNFDQNESESLEAQS